jgi:heme-degrading monooxygenase HmoA
VFARVSTIQGKPERVEEGIHNFNELMLPAAKKITGFKGGYLLVDRKSGKMVGITMWETEQALQASSAAADRLRAQGAQHAGASKPPLVEMFEVAVQP